MSKQEKYLGFFTFNNIFPIITSLIIMTLAFAKLQMDIALLNQKVDMIVENQKEILRKYTNVETRYGELSLEVQTIKTEHAMNRSR